MSTSGNAPPIERPQFIGERPMNWTMPVSFLGGLILAVWLTTEFFAWRFHYNPALGRPFFHVVYAPWQILVWLNQFYSPFQHLIHRPFPVYPKFVYDQFKLLPYVAGGSFVIGVLFAALVSLVGQKGSKNPGDLYDSGSKWAGEKEARDDKLLGGKAGPIIGGIDVSGTTRPLRYGGELGVTYTESPGGGKSSFLKSNLLIPLQHLEARKWSERERRLHPWGEEPVIIASDPKFELHRETSGYQAEALRKNVKLLAPLGVGRNVNISPDELACYNPFWNIRLGTDFGFQDCLYRTLSIIDAEGEGLKTHWDRTALGWGAAVIEKLGFRAINLRDPEIFSLPGLLEFISGFGTIQKLLDHMLNEPDDPAGVFAWREANPDGTLRSTVVKPSIAQATREMLNKEAREQSGVFSSFIAFMTPYRSEILRKYITRSSFNWSTLANDRDRSATVYIGMDPMDIPKARAYLRMVTGAAVEELTSGGTLDMGGRSARGNFRPVVLMMDEAAAWRRLQEIEHGSGYFRGYGVYLWLIWQSVAQQRKYYGKENLLDETMDVLMYGRPKTQEGAEFIQELLGERTELVRKRSLAGGRWAVMAPQAQDTIDAQRLPVLSTKEILQLDKDRYFVFYNGRNYYMRKWEYFKNPTLSQRARIPYVKTFDSESTGDPLFIQSVESVLSLEQMARWTDYIENKVKKRADGSPQSGLGADVSRSDPLTPTHPEPRAAVLNAGLAVTGPDDVGHSMPTVAPQENSAVDDPRATRAMIVRASSPAEAYRVALAQRRAQRERAARGESEELENAV
jgi:type IV secretion system protein VirD4